MNIDLGHIYAPIRRDLDRVDEIIGGRIVSDVHSVNELNDYITKNPGKYLRAALSLFSARCVTDNDNYGDELANFAAGVELIHAAALMHDDVLDSSVLRRYKSTINADYGDNVAVAFGGYLYSKGLSLIAKLNVPEIIHNINDAISGMCEGELTQILNRGKFELKRQTYMDIIRKKTAFLMSFSCSSAIILVKKSKDFYNQFSSFGMNFGMAFQIIDDCMDFLGDQDDLGKTTGLDLKKGELTLPILFLMEEEYNEETKNILDIIYSGRSNNGEKERLKEMLISSGTIEKSINVARDFMEKAKNSIKDVKDSIYKEKLIELVDLTLSNSNLLNAPRSSRHVGQAVG